MGMGTATEAEQDHCMTQKKASKRTYLMPNFGARLWYSPSVGLWLALVGLRNPAPALSYHIR
jgi:hypothetical protein